jgi:hypothetical protein
LSTDFPYPMAGVTATMILEETMKHAVGDVDWPSAALSGMAKAASALFPDDGYTRSAIGVALEVREQEVAVCYAGPFRAHLVRGGHVHHVTRDHNVFDDPATVDQVHAGAPPELYRRIASRFVGGALPPEHATWPLEDPDVIVVCSENVHRLRDPKEYAVAMARPDFSFFSLGDGLASAISRRVQLARVP